MENDLNLINESNDTDNSKVVIFDSEAEMPLSTSFGASQGIQLNFINRSNGREQ